MELLEGALNQTVVKFDRVLIVAGKGPTVDIRIKGTYEKDVVFIISASKATYDSVVWLYASLAFVMNTVSILVVEPIIIIFSVVADKGKSMLKKF